MNTLGNKYDALESLIHREGLRIEAIDIHQEMEFVSCHFEHKSDSPSKNFNLLKAEECNQ